MYKKILVERDFEEGRRLLEALDNAGFPVRAAFWYHLSDSDKWRFIVASPVVDEKGPRAAYTVIQSVLATLSKTVVGVDNMPRWRLPFGISLMDITVMSPKDQLIRLLRKVVRTGPGIHWVEFPQGAINNVFVEDAYIYRMQ